MLPVPSRLPLAITSVLALFISGCGGVDTYEQTKCIPQVEFEATKSMRILSLKVLNESYNYSSLIRKKDDLFAIVMDPLDFGFDAIFRHPDGYQYGPSDKKALYTVLPVGSRFRLTGTVRRTKPWGIVLLGGSGSYYFEARREIKTAKGLILLPTIYWFGSYDFSELTAYPKESELNVESAKVVGAGLWGDPYASLGVDYDWQCPLGERPSIEVD